MAIVSGYENGNAVKLTVDEESMIEPISGIGVSHDNSIQWGDVISYTLTSKGRIKSARVIFRTAKAQHYLPDIYGDGSFYMHSVNFFNDNSNPLSRVSYYYGLAIDKYESEFDKLQKLTLSRNDKPVPTELEEKLLYTEIIALNGNTVYYRYDKSKNNSIYRCYFSDIVSGNTLDYGKRTNDLVFVRTINGIATEVILIAP